MLNGFLYVHIATGWASHLGGDAHSWEWNLKAARWCICIRVHRCQPRSLTKLTMATASSLCHLAGDDEILQWASEFHLKDTPLRGGCRQRWSWACRLWSFSPDRLTTARRGRLSRLPRSWGTLLLSGQRAPAAPVTTRKEVRRGQRRSDMDGGGRLSHVAAQSK